MVDYAAPDAELWAEMKRALGDVAMSFPAHMQVRSVVEQIEREATARALRAKVKPPRSPEGATQGQADGSEGADAPRTS